MASARTVNILRYFEPPRTDRELLLRFAGQRDEAAFAELARRHGPCVWAACLRTAGHRQDAEDAFQAVFLILSRKAGAIAAPDLLGNWLYGVAVRVARQARRSANRRRVHEVQVDALPDQPSPPDAFAEDLNPVIDEELAALPTWYRDAVVLCDLRGVSREDAAKLLAIPEGTLSSRLANGRKKLAARLTKRGVTLPATAVPLVLGQSARAAVPAELVLRANQTLTGTAITVDVARLASGGYFVKSLLVASVVCVTAAAVGVVYAGRAEEPSKPVETAKPTAVAKGEPAPVQKPEEKVEFTTQPRMRAGQDLRLKEISRTAWSQDGKMLAIQGKDESLLNPQQGKGGIGLASSDRDAPRNANAIYVVQLDKGSLSAGRRVLGGLMSPIANLVGFSPESNKLIVDQREAGLLSSFHRLYFYPVEAIRGKSKNDPDEEGGVQESSFIILGSRTVVNLESTDTRGYAFASDGKTFRTVTFYFTRGDPKPETSLTVTSVETSTGKTLKTLMGIEGAFTKGHTLSRDGRKLAVADADDNLTVYDVDAAKTLWTKPLKNYASYRLEFSPDGRRLAVLNGEFNVLFDSKSGEQLPRLEHGETHYIVYSSFTGDGRLLAASGGRNGQPFAEFACVWDTETGKLLKRWNRQVNLAFHPTKPILAMLEPHDSETRLGLWDFAAEVEKK